MLIFFINNNFDHIRLKGEALAAYNDNSMYKGFNKTMVHMSFICVILISIGYAVAHIFI